MTWATGWPIWLVVLACAASCQAVKLLIYSLVHRRFKPGVLGQTHGLPSLQAASLASLLVDVSLRRGWDSGETSFALVFVVIVVFDLVRVRSAARDQRYVVFHLVEALPTGGVFRQRVADYLDIRTHHPVHVAIGAIFGALFALAFGLAGH